MAPRSVTKVHWWKTSRIVHGDVKIGPSISGELPEWCMSDILLLSIVKGKSILVSVLHNDKTGSGGTNHYRQIDKNMYSITCKIIFSIYLFKGFIYIPVSYTEDAMQ